MLKSDMDSDSELDLDSYSCPRQTVADSDSADLVDIQPSPLSSLQKSPLRRY